jgi:predicted O-methyltransferase YrrM
MIDRALKFLLGKVVKRAFVWFERLGFHIMPVHYYSPIPEVRKLPSSIWKRTSELVGIDMNEDFQLKLLEEFKRLYGREYNSLPLYAHERTKLGYYVYNPSFGPVDGEIYYCMIRHFKPKRIVEVGAGFSTLLAAEAVEVNRRKGYDCELIAVDPYPTDFLRRIPRLRLVEKPVQELHFSWFNSLRENDILFIDSTHVVKIGGDVVYLYLEVLPRLNSGVLVHSHDIFLPLEYPRDWVLEEHRFWSEQYLLQAFLAFNDQFEILWAGSYMNLKYPEKLQEAFRSYKRGETLPGSFWIRRK